MMRVLLYLSSLGLLASSTWAQIDMGIVTILLELPSCVQQCSLQTLSRINCPLTDAAKCVCDEPELQKEVATCIIRNCNATEQYIATKSIQENVCFGTNKPSRQNELIVPNIVLSVIAYPAFVLRFVARSQVQRRMWWDDWCVIAAMCCMIPISAIAFFQAKMGFGLHFWDVPADNIVLLRKLYYVVQVLYCLVLAFAKLSIVLLYLQLFPRRQFRMAIFVTIGLVVAKALVFVPLVIFQCNPVRSIWTQEPAKCINPQMLVYWGAGISIFEDLLIMCLPIFELKHLKVSMQTRIGLGLLFALGSCACLTSIIRLKYTVAFGNSVDVTFDNVPVYAWSVIELFTAIICSCLICYRPLVVKILPAWLREGGSFRLPSSHGGKSSSTIKSKKSNRSFQDTERSVDARSSIPMSVMDSLPETVVTQCYENRGERRISDLGDLSDINESLDDAPEITEKKGLWVQKDVTMEVKIVDSPV